MLLTKNLERFIEMETDLKTQHQVELNSKITQITQAKEKQTELKAKIAKLESTIADQLKTIKTVTANASNTKLVEQQNREIHARVANLQEEVDTQKKRTKTLQKDLAVEREELKALKALDPQKMKKNLDASKKKLADQTSANELLQKSNGKFKKENEALKQQVKELEEKVAESEKEVEAEPEAAEA